MGHNLEHRGGFSFDRDSRTAAGLALPLQLHPWISRAVTFTSATWRAEVLEPDLAPTPGVKLSAYECRTAPAIPASPHHNGITVSLLCFVPLQPKTRPALVNCGFSIKNTGKKPRKLRSFFLC